MPATSPAYFWLPAPPVRPFTWYDGELDVYRQKEPIDCAQWAERHREIRVSSIPGLWRHSNAPYLQFPMECYSLPWVREIVICAGSQLGKTEIQYNTHGYDVDYNPGPSLVVMPTRETVTDAARDRVHPMYEDCRPLQRIQTGNPDDISTTRIKCKNGSITYFGWGGSDAVLASKPIKNLKIDEADLVGRRSINLARARLRTFLYEYKLLEVSKPSTEDGPIWEDLHSCHIIYDYVVPCPHCGHEQAMVFGQYRWPDGITDPKRIESGKLGWYECEACAGHWDEALRDYAVKHGTWRHRDYCIECHDQQLLNGTCPRCQGSGAAPLPSHPEKIGFHLPAFYSRFVPFYTIIADYLRTQSDPTGENLEKFWCDDCALPIPSDVEGETVSEQRLYERREEYGPKGCHWQIPMQACLLTAFTDVQGNRLECGVIAWGPGREVWGIDYRVFTGSPSHQQVWDDLSDYLDRDWLHESGVKLRIGGEGYDTGGHHTDEVHIFAKHRRRMGRRVFPTKGSNTPGQPLFTRPSKASKAKSPTYMIGTEAGKDTLAGWLQTEDPGPRYCHFPHTFGFEFFRQLCSEHPRWKKDSRGRPVKVWELRKGYQRNEALDVWVGNLAVFSILNPNLEKISKTLFPNQEQKNNVSQPVPGTDRPVKKWHKPTGGGFVKGWNR